MTIDKRKLKFISSVLFSLILASSSLANEDKVYHEAMNLLENQKYKEVINLLKEPINVNIETQS